MGVLAPVTPWIPNDDLLLKNAIEAGASLESLAKGAVQFSRRFTIKELQDRWLALLYDPIISAEASAQMAQFERSRSAPPSKSTKADNSKEIKSDNGKRKAESLRSCYYAMRKRIQLSQGDLNYLVAPGDGCFITGAEGREGPGPESMLGDPISSHFGLEDVDFDDLHPDFPPVMRDNALRCGVGDFPNGQTVRLVHPQHNIVHKENHHMVGNNLAVAGNCSRSAQMGVFKEHSGHDIFEVNDTEPIPVSNSKGVLCSGFGGNTIFSSPLSECETSFHHLQYASSPPAMPEWKGNEGMSTPGVPDDVRIRENNIHTEDPLCITDTGDLGIRTSEYDIHAESDLNNLNHMSCTQLKTSTRCTELYLDELSNSLLDFNSDDEMLIIDGGKDAIDKTYVDGLNSFLTSSLDDVKDNMVEVEEPAAGGAYGIVPSVSESQEKIHVGDIPLELSAEISFQSNFSTTMPLPASILDLQFPEFRDGVICCLLNTEDPDIPCNDDIMFTRKPRLSSCNRKGQIDTNNSSFPSKSNPGAEAGEKGLNPMSREAKQCDELLPVSQTQGLDMKINCSIDEVGVKFVASRGEKVDGSRSPSASQRGLCQSSPAVKVEPSENSLIKQSSCNVTETPGQVAELRHIQTDVEGMKQETQMPLPIHDQGLYILGSADSMAPEPGGEHSLSDPDDQSSDSDAEVPYFSDIESMILDMDLGPEDQDSFCFTEVAKYQHEDAKKAIVRLEQSAHSYMQRALASRGAFAILYGRHSKHYIKKPEVLLGRATDDVSVDIDLGREGRANKISRRQAIIKMESDGTFNLRNLGRCSIYVNSKEIFPGQALGLHSNCLIEIRGMPFIFETSQAAVKKSMLSAVQKSGPKWLNAR